VYAVKIKCLGALAFVPPGEVLQAYEELANSPFFQQNACLHPLLDYFERTWVGQMNIRTGVRGSPLFRVPLWNAREATLNGEHRSTNSLEGWHRQFYGRVGATHPNIWTYIKDLKDEQILVNLKIENFLRGRPPPKKDVNMRRLMIV